MSEIKPVYEARQYIETKFAISEAPWQEVSFEKYQELLNVSTVQTRILYPAAPYEALQNERKQLRKIVFELFNNERFFELPASLKDSIAAIVNGEKL